jgi:hypothetical protein
MLRGRSYIPHKRLLVYSQLSVMEFQECLSEPVQLAAVDEKR